VERALTLVNRFNGFYRGNKGKTVETVSVAAPFLGTGLKPGVNETTFEARLGRAINMLLLWSKDPVS
jgi:hypothetical protein